MKFIEMIVKLILGIVMLPVTVAAVVAFYLHLSIYPGNYIAFFSYGCVGFLVTFLFLYQFWGVYEAEQGIMSGLFKFIAPFDQFVVKAIPLFSVIIMFFVYFFKVWMGLENLVPYCLFFVGFFLLMHLFLTAQIMQDSEKTPVKPNYLFWINIIFVSNIFCMILLFDLSVEKFTFPIFFSSVTQITEHIYTLSWEKVGIF